MTITELIKRLQTWEKKFGDIEVEAIHSGFFGYHKIMNVTMPDNRRVIVMVTMPAEWWEEEMKLARESLAREEK
jgi:hypothetical protein